jgi:hypothetical protein
MSRADAKSTWALFWLAAGVGAMTALIATPGLPRWSFTILALFAAICFTISAKHFGKLNRLSFFFVWIGIGLFWYKTLPPPSGRHLTREQREGLANLRDSFPPNCGLLVYVPGDSAESQNYGKEIQSALTSHGKKANLIYEGVMVTPIGVVVGVHSSLEPCGHAGEMLSLGIEGLHIPTRLAEDFPRASDTVSIIYVGAKQPYD